MGIKILKKKKKIIKFPTPHGITSRSNLPYHQIFPEVCVKNVSFFVSTKKKRKTQQKDNY